MDGAGRDALEGNWEMVRAELDGEAAPPEIIRQTTLHLIAGRYEVWFAARIVDRGTYTANDTTAIRTLVLHGTNGTNAGRTIPCVYQHVGDRLRICFGLDGTLPADFSTGADGTRYLVTYRRQRLVG